MSVNITLPVLNEEKELAANALALRDFCVEHLHQAFLITIVDNGSQDQTAEIARSLAAEHSSICAIVLPLRGRGRALRHSWTCNTAEIQAYMDIDLSTDLRALPRLISLIADGSADVVIGSRLRADSIIKRGLKREILSRCYNRIARSLLGIGVMDLQCGFKALSKPVADALLPRIDDDEWFFDTELIFWAERLGYSVREIPICWRDDPDSRVRLVPTIMKDIRGLLRLARQNRNLRRGLWRRKGNVICCRPSHIANKV